MMGALVFFFFRAAEDADRKQEAEDAARGSAPACPRRGGEARINPDGGNRSDPHAADG